jgi:isocitrate dehydrogenase kinase/phosphatase
MLTEIDGKVFKIYFKREVVSKTHVVERGPGFTAEVKRRWVNTTAYLESDEITYSGKSSCDPFDVFIKEKGRTLALKDAMKELPESFRKEVWKAYHNRFPDTEIQDIFAVLELIEKKFSLEAGALTSQIPH